MSQINIQPTTVKSRRHWYGLSAKKLLFLAVIAILVGLGVQRIAHNRSQRDAVHRLWRSGASTADGPGEPFRPPFGKWRMEIQKEGWPENLLGLCEPWAVLFDNDYLIYDAKTISQLVRDVPSIKHVFIGCGMMRDQELTSLPSLLPDVTIHHAANPPQPQRGSPTGGSDSEKMVK
jgi:hypothetical protein